MKPFWTRLVLALAFTLANSGAHAIEAGKDYLELSPAQPVSVKRGQIEVLEFFWYRCPHCFNLEPALKTWARKLPKDVVLKQVPGILNPSWIPLARAFYALEAVGLQDKLHGEAFHAIHVQGMDLNPPDAFLDWAVTKGVDRKKLEDAYNGFAVNTKVMRAQQMTKDFKLNGVPAIVVNGKYLTSAYMTGSEPDLFKVVDELIASERKAASRKR